MATSLTKKKPRMTVYRVSVLAARYARAKALRRLGKATSFYVGKTRDAYRKGVKQLKKQKAEEKKRAEKKKKAQDHESLAAVERQRKMELERKRSEAEEKPTRKPRNTTTTANSAVIKDDGESVSRTLKLPRNRLQLPAAASRHLPGVRRHR